MAGLVPVGVRTGTLLAWPTGAPALAQLLVTGPIIISTLLWLISFDTALAVSDGTPLSSSTIILTLRPWIPPRLLTCFSQRRAAFLTDIPKVATSPVTGVTRPITISSAPSATALMISRTETTNTRDFLNNCLSSSPVDVPAEQTEDAPARPLGIEENYTGAAHECQGQKTGQRAWPKGRVAFRYALS